MKKKIVFLLFVILLLSGCQVNYDIVIGDDNKITEKVVILEDNSFFGKNISEINEQLDWTIIFASDEVEPAYFYNKKKIVGNDSSGLELSYSFNTNNFLQESDILRNCFEEYTFSVNENILNISANNFKCLESLGNNGQANVRISVNGKLIDGNFNKKEENTYLWNLKKGNDNNIELSINRLDYNNVESNNNTKIVVVILLIITSLIGIILLVAFYKNKVNNKI